MGTDRRAVRQVPALPPGEKARVRGHPAFNLESTILYRCIVGSRAYGPERALITTKLPEHPDYEAANRFLIRARREAANPRMSTNAHESEPQQRAWRMLG